ncbi:hypothetical protein Tco_0732182, partial [Tanacetum coccineum]
VAVEIIVVVLLPLLTFSIDTPIYVINLLSTFKLELVLNEWNSDLNLSNFGNVLNFELDLNLSPTRLCLRIDTVGKLEFE